MFIGLVNNAALLLALALIYDLLPVIPPPQMRWKQQLLTGVILGGIGIAVMLTPWEMLPGLVFDTRSVLLGVAGLFFGPHPTLVAILMTAALRVAQGGVGAWMGVPVIIVSGTIGILWRSRWKGELKDIPASELFFMGIAVHCAMLLCAFFMPLPVALHTLANIALPVMLIYPLGTMCLGLLVAFRLRRRQTEDQLLKSEERYYNFISQSFEGIHRTEFDQPVDISLPVEAQIDLIYERAYMGECNQAMARMYKWASAEEFVGARLIDVHGGKENPVNRLAFRKLIENGYKTVNDETVEYDRDGQPVWFLNNTVGIIEKGHLVRLWGTTIDITERKQAEEDLKAALQEKEVLLRELYHRTKNNMQVIRAMLTLQAGESDSQEVQRLVRAVDTKIQAMALVHQMLYRSNNLSSIDLKTYIEQLSGLVLAGYAPGCCQVSLALDLEPVSATLDIAIPVGLILNELFTNACQHAFPAGPPNGRPGEIRVALSRRGADQLCLEFSDNGVSVPPEFDLRGQPSYGLQSVFSLAEGQLKARVEVDTSRGLAYSILFSDTLYAQRV